MCVRVHWHFEQQGRHVVCIKDKQTDGCQVRKKKKYNTMLHIHQRKTLKYAYLIENISILEALKQHFSCMPTNIYYLRAFW